MRFSYLLPHSPAVSYYTSCRYTLGSNSLRFLCTFVEELEESLPDYPWDSHMLKWYNKVAVSQIISRRLITVLLNFWSLRVDAYSRWALIRGWALIKFSPFSASVVVYFSTKQQMLITKSDVTKQGFCTILP